MISEWLNFSIIPRDMQDETAISKQNTLYIPFLYHRKPKKLVLLKCWEVSTFPAKQQYSHMSVVYKIYTQVSVNIHFMKVIMSGKYIKNQFKKETWSDERHLFTRVSYGFTCMNIVAHSNPFKCLNIEHCVKVIEIVT